MYCPKCKIEIPDDSKFCSNCGVNIAEYNDQLRAEKYMNCPNCNKEIERTSKFCKYCGAVIEGECKKSAKKSDTWQQYEGCIYLIGALVIMVVIVLGTYISNNIFLYSPQQQNMYSPPPPPQPVLEVVSDRMVNEGYDIKKIEGVVKNTSDANCMNPYVEIYTFDADGNRVGEHPIPILNSLAPGESYKFTIYDSGATRYEFHACRCGY